MCAGCRVPVWPGPARVVHSRRVRCCLSTTRVRRWRSRSITGHSRPVTHFRHLAEALTILADLVLPRACAGCGRPGEAACARCAAALAGPPVLAAPGPTASPGRRGHHPASHSQRPGRPCGPSLQPALRPAMPPAFAAASYTGAARVLLLSYKERGRVDLAAVLGQALARAVAAALVAAAPGGRRPPPVLLVPVPTTAAARRRRGVDHVARLAAVAARSLAHRGLRARVSAALRVSRPGADQAGLGAAARSRNRSGAFALRTGVPSPRPGEITVVVDDIVTTGATVWEAVRALRAGGWAPAAGAAVAATPLQHGRDAPSFGIARRPGGGRGTLGASAPPPEPTATS